MATGAGGTEGRAADAGGLEETTDLAGLRAEPEAPLLEPGPLADAVAGAATSGSLVVVAGGRDRGSFAERVAFRARCSVLVVRQPAAAR